MLPKFRGSAFYLGQSLTELDETAYIFDATRHGIFKVNEVVVGYHLDIIENIANLINRCIRKSSAFLLKNIEPFVSRLGSKDLIQKGGYLVHAIFPL